LNQEPSVDTTPIVNPDAFRYLDKPSGPEYTRDLDDVPLSAIKPPKFIVPLTNIIIQEGDNAFLTCKLEGYPFPTVIWFKDNQPLPASTRLLPNYNLNSGVVSLRINDIQPNDQGQYVAFAKNKAGEDQTYCTIEIKITPNIDSTPMVSPEAFKYLETPRETKRPDDRDRVNYQPPKFIIPLSNVKLDEGQSVQLACKVEGYPKPRVIN
jgi:hypothetical protein